MSLTTRKSVGGLNKTAPQSSAPAVKIASSSTLLSLPERPVAIIEPRRPWLAVDFGELWAHRELLYFLAWRDVKVRYKQAALGAAWAILQPLFLMLIFTLFYGRLAGINTGRIPYTLFAYSGLVLWTFFANATSTSSNSLVNSTHLITKVYFPRLLVPMAAVAATLIDFCLAFALLVGLMAYYGVGLTASALILPPMTLMTALFALGVGTWLSALNVKYRDIRFALTFMMQIWLFVSSVVVPSSVVPLRWRRLLLLNPMSAYVEGYRAALFGEPFDWRALSLAAAITVAILVFSAFEFRRMERRFADII